MMDRHQTIKQKYGAISKFLKEIHDVVKIPKTGNEWGHYREYVNDIIIKGKTSAIVSALKKLFKRI